MTKPLTLTVGMTLVQAEVATLLAAMEDARWDTTVAARTLGVARSVVYHDLVRFGINIKRREIDPDSIAGRVLARQYPPRHLVRQIQRTSMSPPVDVREQGKPHAPCPICRERAFLEPTSHPKVLICMRPNCIFLRAGGTPQPHIPAWDDPKPVARKPRPDMEAVTF